MADAGAFTNEQLREFKRSAERRPEIRGSFNWMRRSFLGVVGGNYFYECPILVRLQDTPMVWFNRDDGGYFLLNIDMPSTDGGGRLQLRDNFWILRGRPADFDCPPNGRKIRVKYPNGDALSIEFLEVEDAPSLKNTYAIGGRDWTERISFPVLVAEVELVLPSRGWSFSAKGTSLPGYELGGNFLGESPVGLTLFW